MNAVRLLRRGLLLVILALFFCEGVRVSAQGRAASRKSLLLIVADTMRFDAGHAGTQERDRAVPASLRERGCHFTDVFAAGDYTNLSMAALLTGHYGSDFGLINGRARIRDSKGWTLAERLRKAGYATAAVVSNPVLKIIGLDAGVGHYDGKMTGYEPNRHFGRRSASETTAAAERELDALSSGEQPWFLWVHYLEPHGPYEPPARFLKPPAEPGPPLPMAGSSVAPRGMFPRYQYLPACRGRNDYIARYQASARYVLSEIERLLDHAYSSGALREAVVVFTSDHGEFLGEENYWFEHGVGIDPAVVHVPLVIARSPAEPLSYDGRAVSNIDLSATLLPLLDGERPADTAGVDLFGGGARERPIVVESLEMPERLEIGAVTRDGLIVRSNREPPAGFRRRGAGWQSFAPTRRMLTAASRVIRPMAERIRKTPADTPALTPEEIRELRSLGYLNPR
jgi:arylsulfatase A-like enzyme